MIRNSPTDNSPESFAGPRRFVEEAGERFARYLTAAQDYPKMLTPEEAHGLYRKPFGVGSRSYIALAMCQLLTVIDKLELSPGALFVDAGAGS